MDEKFTCIVSGGGGGEWWEK